MTDIITNEPNKIIDTTFNDVQEILKNYEILKKNNISKPILNKYEKTKVLGIRAEQIRHMALALIVVPPYMTNELDIACEELKQRKIPFILRRKVGSKYEYWKLEDLHY